MLEYFPKHFTSKAITLYLVVLVLVNIAFMNHFMPLLYWAFGIISVMAFFYFSNQFTRQWGIYSEKLFAKKLFRTALIIRIVYVVFSYYFYQAMTGVPFEFHAADVMFYNNMGEFGANQLLNGNFDLLTAFRTQDKGIAFSDSGYPYYLSIIYALTGNSILIARLFKALWSAWMCVLIYKLAARNFDESVARMAAIFCMLMPNFIYYCGIHLKETEMVFLAVFFLERADHLLRGKNYSFMSVFPVMLIGASLFVFRTPLGATAMFALFTTVFLSSKRVMKMNKKIVLGIWVFVVIVYFVGGTIATEIEELWQARQGNQETSMQWRATREGGNEFAKYASASVFAPMIFVIPFPTMVNTPGQDNQRMIHGGNYIKNIMAFFTIFALFLVVKQRRWGDYLLIGSYTIGYLGVIAFSAFAHSERFHLPALPMILVMAAYGISQVTNKTKRYYMFWLAFIFVAIVAWSWFKLAGRGLA